MTAAKNETTTIVRLDGVRLSYPALDKMKPNFKGSDEMSYQASLLIPPKFDFTKFNLAVKAVMLAGFGKLLDPKQMVRPILKDAKLDEDGWKVINSKSKVRVPIVGPDKVAIPVEEIAERLYAGCVVNAVIEPWAQKNDFGKAINYNLKAIQFVKDGERLDSYSKPVDPDAAFEALELPSEDGAAPAADGEWSPF